MRDIDMIIWHCAATKEGQDFTVDDIRSWHKAKGWSDIGYHYVIELDGTVKNGRPVAVVGAHVKGKNAHSIGICYVGGLDRNGDPKDTRTPEQKRALYELTTTLRNRFPGATVHGHNEFANKACPCFDASADWRAYVLTMPIAKEDIEEDEVVPG